MQVICDSIEPILLRDDNDKYSDGFGYCISNSVWVNIVGLSGFKNMELLTPSAFFIAFLLVLQWVAYFWVRVGSVYDYLGYGSGKGIALSFKPGTRVPSGNVPQ